MKKTSKIWLGTALFLCAAGGALYFFQTPPATSLPQAASAPHTPQPPVTAAGQSPLPQAPAAAEPGVLWQQADCAALALTAQTQGALICRQSAQAFCAFFEKNGRIFYCQYKDGTLSHQGNIWGSSLTVTRADKTGRPLSQRYYAYGQLARAADFDYNQNQVWRFWWETDQIRLQQQDTQGKTLNKFYFRPDQTYIQYPDGNDMGERGGKWSKQNGQIFIDGAFLCTLPQGSAAPESCAAFAGACTAAQTELL